MKSGSIVIRGDANASGERSADLYLNYADGDHIPYGMVVALNIDNGSRIVEELIIHADHYVNGPGAFHVTTWMDRYPDYPRIVIDRQLRRVYVLPTGGDIKDWIDQYGTGYTYDEFTATAAGGWQSVIDSVANRYGIVVG